jgi:uncharacterized membrane protein YfcA
MSSSGSGTGMHTRRYRVFCRALVVALAGVVLYSVATKLAAGELRDDWAHTALHVATGAAAALAARRQVGEAWAQAVTFGVLVGYGILGAVGGRVDGLLLGSELAIPLGPADDAFHLALAFAAAVVAASPRQRTRDEPARTTPPAAVRHAAPHTDDEGGIEPA